MCADGAGVTAYIYDADGLRVGKGGVTTYVYDALGQLTMDVGPSVASGRQYLTTDSLGSTRLITDGSGNAQTCKDYYPFGEEVPATSGTGRSGSCWADSTETLRFTGKERDAETGLDYFGARYFSGAQGRFTSPDPKQLPHDIADPQSWNKYAYTRNNPLRYVDPDGEDWRDVLKGFVDAYTSDNTLGIGRDRGGNSDFRNGQAVGDVTAAIGGAIETAAGLTGELGSTILDFTGIGAVVGVPGNVATAAVTLHGASAAIIGASNLGQDASDAAKESAPIQRRANDFTAGDKKQIQATNAAKNGGKNVCENCGVDTVPGKRSEKGVRHPIMSGSTTTLPQWVRVALKTRMPTGKYSAGSATWTSWTNRGDLGRRCESVFSVGERR